MCEPTRRNARSLRAQCSTTGTSRFARSGGATRRPTRCASLPGATDFFDKSANWSSMSREHRQLSMWLPCTLYNQRDFPHYYSCMLAPGSQTMNWDTLAARVGPECKTAEASEEHFRWCPTNATRSAPVARLAPSPKPSGDVWRYGDEGEGGDDEGDGGDDENVGDVREGAFEEASELPCEV